ncbi:NAD(P)-dependent oxidoreductase [Robiginitomaculum antarcticum]|uniref:NAD(P)-dependent oxidoreductase n=1 Tax=Robiginitomaculum antarcticum TaxID=437507 RepID=UPI00037C17C0|nr:NAD(P)-dependent oxidoreductase [Robiginitomaculum antarcticum]
MSKCAFLGLGVMGYPMAGHLVAAGHDVTVWNRSAAKAKGWAEEYNGEAADTIALTVDNADFVFVCVGDDPDVYDVVRPAIAALAEGAIIIDHTTASATCARALFAEAKAKEIGFIDAPISGGEAGAVNGQLTVMCGGDRAVFDLAKPVIDAYAKAVKLMGPSGAGQLTKMVNQICIAGILQGLAEGINFAQKSGLDVDNVVGAIGKGAAQSWQMDNRASTMGRGEYEFGFALDWMRKDLRIALETAEEIGADLTLARQVDGYYAQLQNMGGGRWDTSALLARLQND